ncbi:MAG: translocation/assembly module TamB domain-containing protein [bacterium]|nr:MAG: translocation/assembly module TamB domain-containing protein [bacterium]
MKRRITAFLLIIVLAGITVAMKIITSPRLDTVIRNVLVQQAEEHLGVRLSLGSLDHNILLTRFTLEDVTLSDLRGEGREIRARRLIIAFDPYATFRGMVSVSDIQLEGIDLRVVHGTDGSVSVDPILPFWQGEGVSDRSRIRPVKVEFKRFSLIDSHLSYRDLQAGLDLDLDKVLINVGRGRFDSPDRRNITVSSRSGQLKWRAFPEGRAVPIQSIRANLVYGRNEIELSRVSLLTGPIQVELSGTVPLEKSASLSGSLEIVADLDELSWLLRGGKGKIRLSGEIVGQLSSPEFRGRLTSDEVHLADRTFDDLNAVMEMDSGGGRLTDLLFRYREEEIEAAMDIRFHRDLPFSMEVKADDYPIFRLIQEFQKDAVKPLGELDISCRIEGRLSPAFHQPGANVRLTGQGEIPLSQKGAARAFTMDVRGTYQDQEMLLEDFQAQLGSARLTAAGTMSREGFSVEFRVQEDDLAPWSDVLLLDDMRGNLVAGGEITGSWLSPVARMDIVAKGLSGGDFTVDLVEAHADVDRSGISFPLASVKIQSSAVTFQGEFPWSRGEEAWFSVGVSSGRIEDLIGAIGVPLHFSGEVTALMNFSMRHGSLVGAGETTMRDLSLFGEVFQECRFKLEVLDDGMVLNRVELVKAERLISGRAELRDGRFKARLKSEDPVLLDEVWALKKLKVPLTGDMVIEVEAEGTLDGEELSADARLQWQNISFEGRPWHSGKGTFVLKNRTLEGAADLIDSKLSARAVAELGGEFPFSGTIRSVGQIEHSDLNDFLGLGISSDFASGRGTASARARGILADLDRTEVEGVLDDFIFRIRGLNFSSRQQAPFTYTPEDGIIFEDLKLKSGESEIEGSLVIAPGGSLGGTVSGGIDLGGFSFLEPTVDTFSGRTDIEVKVSGSLAQPYLSGFVTLMSSSCVAHLPFPMEITGLAGRIEVVKDRLHFESITGRVGAGSLIMTGDIFFRGLQPVEGDLEWRGESIPVKFPEGLSTVNRGHVTMRFSGGKGDVRGAIQMDEGRYNREIDLDNLAGLIGEGSRFKVSGEPGDRAENGGGDWLALDIEMTTVNPIDVDIKLIRGEARGALRLQGTAARPLLSGRLEMDEGIIQYRGKAFDITQGTVGFFNPQEIEPNFDFAAKAEVSGLDRDGVLRDYEVDLVAAGVPTKFQLDLMSSPPLSEADVISLLTWGAVGEQAFAEGGGISATEATLILTQQLRGKLETEVQQITGFDRFVIDPAFVSSKGERVPRVRVDKRLGDRLSLSASTPILSGEESEFLLRYRISDTFSLLGEQGGESEFGLDLDFKFEIP